MIIEISNSQLKEIDVHYGVTDLKWAYALENGYTLQYDLFHIL
jgi:hypothetical protein